MEPTMEPVITPAAAGMLGDCIAIAIFFAVSPQLAHQSNVLLCMVAVFFPWVIGKLYFPFLFFPPRYSLFMPIHMC